MCSYTGSNNRAPSPLRSDTPSLVQSHRLRKKTQKKIDFWDGKKNIPTIVYSLGGESGRPQFHTLEIIFEGLFCGR